MRLFLLTILICAACSAQVPEGASRSEVLGLLGEPRSESVVGDRVVLNYPEFTVLLVGDRVVRVTAKPPPTAEIAPRAIPSPAKVTPPQPMRQQAVPTQPRPSVRAIAPSSPAPALTIRPRPVPPPVQQPSAFGSMSSMPPPVRTTQNATRPLPTAVFDPFKPWLMAVAFFGILALVLSVVVLQIRRNRRGSSAGQRVSVDPAGPLNTADAARSAKAPVRPDPLKMGWSLATLRAIEWHGFEKLVADFYRVVGYRAELTSFGADGGVDVEVFESGVETPRLIIQCKAFDSEPVGVKLVRELYGVAASRGGLPSALFTTSDFTAEARAFGNQVGMDLVTGEEFLRRVGNLPLSASLGLLERATAGDYTTPTCPSCGVKMVLRTAGRGPAEGRTFWGCVHFPRCTSRFAVVRV